MRGQGLARRVWKRVTEENLSILAAGVAYYGLLAIFPTLAAIVAIYGLVTDPILIQHQITALGKVIPPSAAALLSRELHDLASTSKSNLSFGLIIAVVVSIFSATKGISALMTALNIAYRCRDARGFVKRLLIMVGLTAGTVLFVVAALLLIIAVPPLLHFANEIGIGRVAGTAVQVLRWPVLAVLMALGLSVLFRYAPDRHPRHWHPLGWGAVAGAVLWIIASLIFSLYVSNFGSINKTYGSIGAVVILLMWFYVTAYVIILAATADAQVREERAQRENNGGVWAPEK
jgi:membrane protein